jgi:hypothetical protein
MMAKMFYTMDEAKAALGRSEDEIRQFAREGRLREFRDGPRLMFKSDQVEQLRSDLGGGPGVDQVDLGMSDSGGLIGLVDTTGASGTSITLSDSEGSSGSLKMKDDTALAADLGLSGSLGGVPSPGPVRSGGMPSGTGLSGSMSSRSGAGINVFGTDDSIEPIDPMAQTSISGSIRDQIDLQSVGSGSGLLDLTRESDDTSLGAVLDEINPPPPTRRGGVAASGSFAPLEQSEGSLGGAFEDVPSPPTRLAAQPVMVEREDPLAPAFGGAALAAALVSLFGLFVLTSAVLGTRPASVEWFATKNISLVVGAAIFMGLVVFFFVGGLVVGRLGKR